MTSNIKCPRDGVYMDIKKDIENNFILLCNYCLREYEVTKFMYLNKDGTPGDVCGLQRRDCNSPRISDDDYAWHWKKEEDIKCPRCTQCHVYSIKDRERNEPKYACHNGSCLYDWFHSTPDNPITELCNEPPCPKCGWRSTRITDLTTPDNPITELCNEPPCPKCGWRSTRITDLEGKQPCRNPYCDHEFTLGSSSSTSHSV